MRFRLALVVILATLVAAPVASAYIKLYGTVGPGPTIVLKRGNGTVVKSMHHGTRTFVIHDKSAAHNFHLVGPGVDKRTNIGFVGTRKWIGIVLRPGTYTILCDAHPSTMRKTFQVN